MEEWQRTTLDQFTDEASCFKVIKLILTGDYINKTNILSTLKSRIQRMISIYFSQNPKVYIKHTKTGKYPQNALLQNNIALHKIKMCQTKPIQI